MKIITSNVIFFLTNEFYLDVFPIYINFGLSPNLMGIIQVFEIKGPYPQKGQGSDSSSKNEIE